jgi:hypothetical protein
MARSGQRPTVFFIGFAAGVLASIAYILAGPWGKIPMVNMSVPSAAWARVVFWPGLTAGRIVFREAFLSEGMNTAKLLAGASGILVNGAVWGLVADGVLRLLRR